MAEIKLLNYLKLFEDKNVMPSNYAQDAKSEPEEYDKVKKSEQKSEESIGGKSKIEKTKIW